MLLHRVVGVELRGFGTFAVKKHGAHTGRNPVLSRNFDSGQKEGYSTRKALRSQDVELLGQ